MKWEKIKEDKKINITLEMLKEYEMIRRGGMCDMFDYYCVTGVAKRFKFKTISHLTLEQYVELLENFGKKLTEFNIKQENLVI